MWALTVLAVLAGVLGIAALCDRSVTYPDGMTVEARRGPLWVPEATRRALERACAIPDEERRAEAISLAKAGRRWTVQCPSERV